MFLGRFCELRARSASAAMSGEVLYARKSILLLRRGPERLGEAWGGQNTCAKLFLRFVGQSEVIVYLPLLHGPSPGRPYWFACYKYAARIIQTKLRIKHMIILTLEQMKFTIGFRVCLSVQKYVRTTCLGIVDFVLAFRYT